MFMCVLAYYNVASFAENCQWLWHQFSYNRGVRVHLKALFVYMQLSAGFGRLLDADYPPSVNNFFAWLSFVNFSPSGIFKCLFGKSFNFYGKLLTMTLIPIALGVIVAVYTLLPLRNDRANINLILKYKNLLLARLF